MESLFIGRNTIFLSDVSSTNSYALSMLNNVNVAEGTIIQANYQTQGKGQRGLQWSALQGLNLTFSVILKPSFLPLTKLFYLYQISALACFDSLTELINNSHIDIKIKWPNDILIDKRKIAGILIENNLLNNQINWSVIGIGINVNQLLFDTSPNAVSLKMLTGHEYDLKFILNRIAFHLEKYYLALKQEKYDLIKTNYLNGFLGLNTYLNFEINNQIKAFLVKGISDKGLLLLEDKNGDEIELDVKEVKWHY